MKVETRNQIERIEREMLKVPQAGFPVKNHFAPGIWAREILIAKGLVLIGAIHKKQNFAVLSKGRLRLATDSGPIEICAPYILTVMPGQKNAAVALEDSVWTNFFPNPDDIQDLDVLVEMFSESKASELIGEKDNRQLLANKSPELEN